MKRGPQVVALGPMVPTPAILAFPSTNQSLPDSKNKEGYCDAHHDQCRNVERLVESGILEEHNNVTPKTYYAPEVFSATNQDLD